MAHSNLDTYKRISLLAALAVMLIGLVVIFGWICNIPALTSLDPHWVKMKFNTALGFVLGSSVILLLLAAEKAPEHTVYFFWLARLFAIILLLSGGLTTIEYASGLDFHIDQLLMKQDESALDFSVHGRMSPFTAVMQVIYGFALLLLTLSRKNDLNIALAQCGAFAGGAVAMLTFIGYILDAQSLYAVGHTTAIAVHTAIGFILLGIATLFLEPRSALMRTFTSETKTGEILRRFVPLALFVPAFFGWLRVLGQNIGLYDFQTGLALVVTCWVITWEMGIFWISKKFQEVESVLSEREDQLRAQAELLNLTHDAIVVMELDGKIIFWNTGAERMYGYLKEEAVGRISQDLLKTRFPVKQDEIQSQALKTGKWEGELTHFTKSEQPVTVASRWSIKKDYQNKPIAILEINNDISATKEAERRVSEFYSTVSHELRTPLTSMKGAFKLLDAGRAGDLSSRAKDLVSIGLVETERLIRLINDILDIRKIEAGKFELLMEPIDPKQFVEQTVASVANFAAQYNVHIVSEIESNDFVMGDKDRLVQVLTNLISNAVKFSDAEQTVRVMTTRKDKCVRFSIIDQGPGIDPRNIAKLFRMFQQIDGAEQQKGGTGLGLAVCKSLVEEHGGSIGIDSQVGKGSTFWFEIPVA